MAVSRLPAAVGGSPGYCAADGVVVAPPSLGQHPGFGEAVEDPRRADLLSSHRRGTDAQAARDRADLSYPRPTRFGTHPHLA